MRPSSRYETPVGWHFVLLAPRNPFFGWSSRRGLKNKYETSQAMRGKKSEISASLSRRNKWQEKTKDLYHRTISISFSIQNEKQLYPRWSSTSPPPFSPPVLRHSPPWPPETETSSPPPLRPPWPLSSPDRKSLSLSWSPKFATQMGCRLAFFENIVSLIYCSKYDRNLTIIFDILKFFLVENENGMARHNYLSTLFVDDDFMNVMIFK